MKNGPKCLQCKKPITAAFYKHPAGPVHAEGSCHDGASRSVRPVVDHPKTAWHGASWIEGGLDGCRVPAGFARLRRRLCEAGGL